MRARWVVLVSLVAIASLAGASACGDIAVAEDDNGGEDAGGGGGGGGDDTVAGIERRVVYDPNGCERQFTAAVGGHWVPYDDRDDGGESRSLLAMVQKGDDPGCAMRWTGSLRASIDDPFAGIELEAPEPMGLGEWRTLVIVVRGGGTPLRLNLPREDQWAAAQDPDAAADHWNFHGMDITCGDGTGAWRPVVIDLQRVAQEGGWGETWPRRNDLVRRIRLHVAADVPADWECDFQRFELRRGENP